MKNKYWKYICLLGLGAFCWTCSDDNPNDGPDGPGSEGGQGTEQEIVRSYKIGTLAGFEGNLRQKMDKPSTDVSTMHNRSLFCRYVASAYPEAQDDQPYPGPITEADWWDNFVEEIAYSGQDYVAMNCRGEANKDIDHGRPDKLHDLMAAIKRKGVEHEFKIAIFDDTPASWSAARNAHKGYGYDNKPFKNGSRVEGSHYPLLFLDPEKEDMKGADNDFRKEVYYYIWDANLKPSFENVPRDYWFEIDGRPVILFWNPNGFLQDSYLSELMKKDPAKYKSTTGLDETKSDAYNGKLSYILKCISDDFNSTFGVRPFLIIQREWTDRDFSLVNCPYLDGIHNWFAVPTMDMSEEVYNENLIYNTYISAYNFKGFSVGSGCPGFVQGDLARPNWQFIDADHGRYATKMMESFLAKKPDLVFLEGFTDLAENAAWWRSSDKIYYDYPNQRLNILRKWSSNPYPKEFKVEAEACDYFEDKSSGNSGGQYRKGDLDIKKCNDVYEGWCVTATESGEWLKWVELPFSAGNSVVKLRYSALSAVKIRFDIDKKEGSVVELPATGGTWKEIDAATVNFEKKGWREVVLNIISGDADLNYFTIVAE